MPEFGLNELLGIIMLIIGASLLISEIKAKVKTDLLTNIFISVLLLGVSCFNLISLCFKKETIILTIIYLIVTMIAIAFIIMFIYHNRKYSKEKKEEPTTQDNQTDDQK